MNETSPQLQSACDHQRVDQFLQSDHYRIEDDELITHLDSCTSCREYLESHAADSETWSRAKTLLKTNPYDNAATAAFSAAGSQTQSGHFPHAIQDVLDALAPTDDPHRLGRIGTYEIAGVIGAGAMGVVLKAIDPALDRVIAVKVMSPRLANNETARKRFAREAKAAAAVLHPNVIPIHSVSSDKALPYLVMAYIRGGSLQKRLEKEGPLQLVEILRIGSQIAAGLSAAHEQGLVHRDIKPENILLEEGIERVTITDFGLARAVDDNTVTQMGVIAGTPMYMSPEQARGEQVDQLSDLFSLGSVLYALCTGQPPYRSDSSYGVMRRIIDESPTPIRKLNPAIPEWLACIVERLMAKDKSDRFATASEVHKLLDACLSHVQQPNVIALPAIPGSSPLPEQRSFFKTRKGLLTMFSTAAAILFAAFFMQPDKPSLTITNPAPHDDAVQKVIKSPAISIESYKSDGTHDKGDKLTHRWNLNGESVGNMKIRILHIENGKTRIISESFYQGGKTGEQTINIEFQLETLDRPLPVPGRVLVPELAVSVNGLKAKSEARQEFTLHGDGLSTADAHKGKLGFFQILTYTTSQPQAVDHALNLDEILAASKKGASFIVTTLAWEPVCLDKSLEGKLAVIDEKLDPALRIMEEEYYKISKIMKNLDNYNYGMTAEEKEASLNFLNNSLKPTIDKLKKEAGIPISKPETSNSDLTELLGTWQVTYVEDGGQITTEEEMKNIQIVFTKETMTFHIAGKTSTSTYKLDPTTSPKSIDTTEFEKTKIGIYDLQGDTLRICFAKKSKERPTKFDSQPNSANSIITVLKRVAKQEQPMPAPEKPVTKLSDIKDGDYFIQVTQQAKDIKADFPNDVIPDKNYVPAEDKANLTLRLQFLDKGKQVRIIDKELLNIRKVPAWSRTESDNPNERIYENATGESNNGMGKLSLKQKGDALIATFDVHGSGFPILCSLRGSLVEITDANRAKLEANAIKTFTLEDGDYEFQVNDIAEKPGTKTLEDLIADAQYKPVPQPTSFRVKISNNTFSVNITDGRSPAKIGGKGVAMKEQPWDHLMVYETSGEGFHPGQLTVVKSGQILSAYYKVAGPGIPVQTGYRGMIVKVQQPAAPQGK
jgi:uncharacterized protein (TIGR03067 family)